MKKEYKRMYDGVSTLYNSVGSISQSLDFGCPFGDMPGYGLLETINSLPKKLNICAPSYMLCVA